MSNESIAHMLNFARFTKLYVLPLWPWYLVGLTFLGLTNWITVTAPKYVATITDSLPAEQASDLSQMALILIGLGLCQILCRSLSRILLFWPGRQLEVTAKVGLFDHALRLPQIFFDRMGIGDVISRLSNDLGIMRAFYAFALLQAFNLIFLTGFTITQMWQKSPLITVCALSPVVLMLILSRYLTPAWQKLNRRNQEAVGKLTHVITESFLNVHLVQTQGAQQVFQKLAADEVSTVFKVNMRLIVMRTLLFQSISGLAGLSQVALILVGGYETLAGRFSVGDILAFSIYLVTLAFPLTSLGMIIAMYFRSKAALERLNDIHSAAPESDGSSQGQPEQQTSTPALSIQQLSFTYPDTNVPVLQDINLQVNQGEAVAITGRVGSGKSTLLNLIARLYHHPRDGSITLYGTPLNHWENQSLREVIGYALQLPHLFSDSIENNLTLGSAEVHEPIDSIKHALKAASLSGDVNQFQDGSQTQVGEKGVRLSGGQKQRLALARLFMRRQSLWLLDDVMSAVDARTEQEMIDTLFSQQPRPTLLICTHSRHIMERCHKVVVLHEGRVAAEGEFTKLIENHPELFEGFHNDSTD